MNAIIALCHFCEFHGPSVLFCTQVIIENDREKYFSFILSIHCSTSDVLYAYRLSVNVHVKL